MGKKSGDEGPAEVSIRLRIEGEGNSEPVIHRDGLGLLRRMWLAGPDLTEEPTLPSDSDDR